MLNLAGCVNGLFGIYRSYRKAMECVYAEWGKEALQLVDQPFYVQKWQL